MRHQLYLTVLLLLLSLYCTSGFVAAGEHSCGFDAVKRKHGNIPVTVVRELPTKGQEAWQAYTASTDNTWAPIRILVSTLDLNDTNKHCTRYGQRRPDFTANKRLLCKKDDILTREKKSMLINNIIPAAVKLHQDRLLVKPVNGVLIVPRFSDQHPCSAFRIPAEHHSSGISGYDTVIYAAAGPSSMTDAIAWAVMCARLDRERPVAGALHLDPREIFNTPRIVRVVAHEIAHILGFDSDIFSANNMISLTHNLRGKTAVHMLSSAKVLEKAAEHFNCSNILGVDMEDEGGRSTALSHWERRTAKDELMAGITGIGYYTALTMAAFESTKLYKANWGMEETMSWGKDAGCSLHTEKCMENNITKHPDLFCNATSNTPVCTSDRLGLGNCGLFVYPRNMLPQYRYFTNPRIGGHSFDMADLCPMILPMATGKCNAKSSNVLLGSRTGPSSWCLKGESLEVNGKAVGDVCAEVRCGNESVEVRYYQDDNWYKCPEGEVLTPTRGFTSGKIVCPLYREVCTIAPDGSSRIAKRNSPQAIDGNGLLSIMATRKTQLSRESGGDGEINALKERRGIINEFLAALSAPFLFLASLFSKIPGVGKH